MACDLRPPRGDRRRPRSHRTDRLGRFQQVHHP